MARLQDLFTDIQAHRPAYVGSHEGGHFENRIEVNLKKIGFTRVLSDNFEREEHQELKGKVLGKESDIDVPNIRSDLESHFLKNPFGSQQYPDFLVFEGGRVVSVEVKFSSQKQRKPIWNSGLPRPNGLYIFGSYERKDVTFFRGHDVLSLSEVEKLHDFFDKGLKEYQQEFNSQEMKEQNYGFQTYIRKAFDQTKKHNSGAITDFFNNPNRENLESSVLNHLADDTPIESE